jgi:predicted helicase
VIERYRAIAFSERDKGTRFERLMKAFFLTEPLYKTTIKTVWMWNEFPYRDDFGGNDIGIDLVAKTIDGDYWSIQCKCYAEDAPISKGSVDSFIATTGKKFHDDELIVKSFSRGLFVSTSRNLSANVYEVFQNQHIPFNILTLDTLESSPVDWAKLDQDIYGDAAALKERDLLDHQKIAVEKFHEHFKTADRGRLIMACGTGKTFTSLRIAEQEAPNGLVLFLVPSIALLGQTLEEWSTYAAKPLKAVCVCSDAEVSRRRKKDEDEKSNELLELAYPASTDVGTIIRQFDAKRSGNPEGMTVFFSTYQSIEKVAEAQRALNLRKGGSAVFDLIVCDEAHRTTGVSLGDGNGGYDESAFVRVHDNDFIQGRKRLYMTATPRLYKLSDEIKEQVRESDAYLCSMDDVAIYGEEVYRIGFGEAVERGLLSDYKVLVLTVSSRDIPKAMQDAIKNSKGEIETDDISKLIGCINALSKRTIRTILAAETGQTDSQYADEDLIKTDPDPMHTAVAFCPSIKIAKHYTAIFNEQKELFYETLTPEERTQVVSLEADHVNGGMGAAERQRILAWMKSVPTDGVACRIITNVKCLSEGVDVPSLDAVLFLSAKNSQVDVVQSVGRVMRRAPGKKYGYIIIPVVIPEGMEPEEALDKSDAFAVVWSVLKALRAHDDRFDAEINKIDLNKRKGEHIIVAPGNTIGRGDGQDGSGSATLDGESRLSKAVQQEFAFKFDQLRDSIFARIVKHVGTRKYWELWAKDVAKVAEHHIARIKVLVSQEGEHKKEFTRFLSGLRRNLNPSVSEQEAIEMLAQHIITRPVFEALFEDYSFVQSNAVSISMQGMIDLLHDDIPADEAELMAKFYKSIRERVDGIDNAEGRQRVIVELYDKFFKAAFPHVVEKLGIVYTPVEIVDFIIHSVADVLEKEFGRTLSDENVHILDPFTGTGTFITRLLQSGLIRNEDLSRKYQQELHANEIVLLAYYIASVNIENAYHDLAGGGKYTPFEGICLTDTFQMTEPANNDNFSTEDFKLNSERVEKQKNAPIRIIIGNPPYSKGQENANDNAQNQHYPRLEERIAETYVKAVKSSNKNSLYNSYIKAFRWATDRLEGEHGIVAFITNSGWLEANASAGFRKCLVDEFDSIYVLNLRGAIRGKSGIAAKQEGQNVFDILTGVAITILVKNKTTHEHNGKIRYYCVPDYQLKKDKLDLLKKNQSIFGKELVFSDIKPDNHGDWLTHRNDVFSCFIPLGEKKTKEERKANPSDNTVFLPIYSNGLKTQRDAWCYNSSLPLLQNNIQKTLCFYNSERERYHSQKPKCKINDFIEFDATKGSWTRALLSDAEKNKTGNYHPEKFFCSIYRPFFKQHVYFDRMLNEMVYQMPQLFPTPHSENLLITVPGLGERRGFCTLIVNTIFDLNNYDGGAQCFPRYYYTKIAQTDDVDFFDSQVEQYERHDAITDFILDRCREMYGPKVTKNDIFYYVYAILHSEEYRKAFSADLKKMLPRIPLVESPADYKAFVKAGKELADIHLNYESQPEPDNVAVKGEDLLANNYTVQKMTFAKKRNPETGKMEDDRSTIIYNHQISVVNIPAEAYDYILNGKSAIEWMMDRYQVKTDKDTGIVNDPNAWAKEHDNPRYILTLLLSVINVSIKTRRIVAKLPALKF